MSNENLGKLVRWIGSVLVSLLLFWMSYGTFLQPVAVALAEESFKKMLIAQGINSKDIADMQTKIGHIDTEIDLLKMQVDKTVRQTDSLEKETLSTKCIAQKLLNLQLGLPASPVLC